MTETIASHVSQCLASLRDLVDPRDDVDFEFPDAAVLLQMKDELSRFKVWSGSIGAHRTGMSSLDYRLRDASHIKAQVINLLQDLRQLAGDATAIVKGEQIPWDQQDAGDGESEIDSDADSDDPDTELGQIAADLADVVNCLLRLSVSIRNPAPHDRYIQTKATDASHFEPYDKTHVESKFGNIEPWLSDRLGKAITRRRQYLRYRQSHHEKLSHGLEVADESRSVRTGDAATIYETVASSIPSHLKDGALLEDNSKLKSRPPIIGDDASDAGLSQTSYATSMASAGRLTIPPLPEEAQKGPFQCSFCYMIIAVSNRTAWKKHVYGDLQPYVCLESDCVTPEREYARRHEWMQHVKENHWKTYKCILGCEITFRSAIDCRHHLEEVHTAEKRQEELDALARLSEQPLDIQQGIPCPLCREVLRSTQQYQRHVGRHQEQLSLFALPSLDTGDENDSNIDSADSAAGTSDEQQVDEPSAHEDRAHPGGGDVASIAETDPSNLDVTENTSRLSPTFEAPDDSVKSFEESPAGHEDGNETRYQRRMGYKTFNDAYNDPDNWYVQSGHYNYSGPSESDFKDDDDVRIASLPSEKSAQPLVDLRIVSSATGIGPLEFKELSVDTNIVQLKERIRESLPTRPTNGEQLLVARAGRIPKDHETLKDIFSEEALGSGDEQTLRLVIRSVTNHRQPSPVTEEQDASSPASKPIPDTRSGRDNFGVQLTSSEDGEDIASPRDNQMVAGLPASPSRSPSPPLRSGHTSPFLHDSDYRPYSPFQPPHANQQRHQSLESYHSTYLGDEALNEDEPKGKQTPEYSKVFEDQEVAEPLETASPVSDRSSNNEWPQPPSPTDQKAWEDYMEYQGHWHRSKKSRPTTPVGKEMPTTTCTECSKDFVPGVSGTSGIFCSEECRIRYGEYVESMRRKGIYLQSDPGNDQLSERSIPPEGEVGVDHTRKKSDELIPHTDEKIGERLLGDEEDAKTSNKSKGKEREDGPGNIPSSEQAQLQVQMQIGDVTTSLLSRNLGTFARSFGGSDQVPPSSMDEFRRSLRQQATVEVFTNWTLSPPTYRILPGETFACDAAGCETEEANLLLLYRHKLQHHLPRERFTCDVDGCTRPYVNPLLLDLHKERVHGVPAALTSKSIGETPEPEPVSLDPDFEVARGEAWSYYHDPDLVTDSQDGIPATSAIPHRQLGQTSAFRGPGSLTRTDSLPPLQPIVADISDSAVPDASSNASLPMSMQRPTNEVDAAWMVHQEILKVETPASEMEVDDDEGKMQAVQEALRQMGACQQGYNWEKVPGGYQCHGGSHFVSDALVEDAMRSR